MTYVVFTCGPHYDVVWTGKTTSLGDPVGAAHIDGALRFETARQAYAAAGLVPRLHNWKVGRLYYRRLSRRQRT